MDINNEHEFLLKFDRAFSHFDDYGKFDILNSVPGDIEFRHGDSALSYSTQTIVSEILTKYGYANITTEGSIEDGNIAVFAELTEKGRKAKAAGGHFDYLILVAEKQKKEEERLHRKDRSDEYDLFIKKWTYKARYLPYIISVGALILSIISYFKPDNKQAQNQLAPKANEVKPKINITLPVDTVNKVTPK
jgi:hypothetical protein